MKHKIFYIIGILTFWFMTTAASCTKVVTYGVDTHTLEVTHTYKSNVPTVLQQSKAALESLGYSVLRVDESRNRITTGWLPVKSDSHYFPLFGRADYSAAAGAYYQMIVDVFTDANDVKASASTLVKSISGRLESSLKAENKFLERLDDFMRSPQIEMTNVGVTER